MLKIRKNSSGDGIIIRKIRGQVIVAECAACGRRDELDRSTIVKRYGASLSLAQLRRRVAMGCERMNAHDGVDRCQTTISAKPES